MPAALAILAVFLACAVLMFLRVLPALLALPVMAVAIGAVEMAAGTLGLADLGTAIIADGAVRLAEPMVIAMLGGMLSMLMQKTGVAESFVRRGAELAGDSPWVVSGVLLAIVALLFTTIGGLGAVIMVGTIVLPILSSMGLREHVSGGVVMIGISLGGLLNAGNWTVYRTVLGLRDDQVSSYALVLFAIVAAVAALFLTVELWRTRALTPSPRLVRRGLLRAAKMAIVAAPVVAGLWLARLPWATVTRWAVAVLGAAAVLAMVVDASRGSSRQAPRWYAYFVPVVPLALILVYAMPFVPAFLCGILYGVVATWRPGAVNTASRAVIEGSASVAPALALMVGIGMLLSAILGPTAAGPGAAWHTSASGPWPVLLHMRPLLEAVVPHSLAAFVLTFTLLGPLALYRGPLNIWGLGYGVAGILLATGMPGAAIMGVLMSLSMIQAVSDPTNTANVWVANEVRLDVSTLMWRTLPYSWAMAALGVLATGLLYMR